MIQADPNLLMGAGMQHGSLCSSSATPGKEYRHLQVPDRWAGANRDGPLPGSPRPAVRRCSRPDQSWANATSSYVYCGQRSNFVLGGLVISPSLEERPVLIWVH
jgi:hypothetical protein